MTNAKSITKRLRDAALRLPGVEEGIACEGTVLEKRTLKVNKKAFVFLGTADAMMKVDRSLSEAAAFAAANPNACKVGKNGWASVKDVTALDPKVLERWVRDSYDAVSGNGATNAKNVTAPKKPSKKISKR